MAESGSRDDERASIAEGQPQEGEHDGALALLSLALEPVAPEAGARDRLLAELRGPRRFAPFTSAVATTFGLPLEHARHALTLFQDPSVWRPGAFPGSAVAPLEGPPGCNLLLARLPAGTRIAHHVHPGRELTFVLQGRLIEDRQRSCTSGQALDMAPGTAHEIAVGDDGECLVVFGFFPP